MNDAAKGRVVFLIRIKPGTQAQFLEAYEGLRHLVANGCRVIWSTRSASNSMIPPVG